MSYDIYTGMLKMFGGFTETTSGVALSYDFSSEKLTELRTLYKLEEIAGDGGDFDRAVKLLLWLAENTAHKGDYDNHVPMNSLALLAYAYKQKENGINCRALSCVLTECLLSLGITTRTAYIMPMSPYDGDNHVVTHMWSEQLNKWVMLDPTYGSYVMDDKNVPLDLVEIRGLLAEQQPIFFNEEIHYNGDKWPTDAAYYREYLAKDLFYFKTKEISRFAAEESNRTITVCPKGYDVKRKEIANIEWRIRQFGDSENMQKWLTEIKEITLHGASDAELVKKPR